MKFCEDCGTYLRDTTKGLWCPKCKKVIRTKLRLKTKRVDVQDYAPIYIVDKSKEDSPKITRICPKCENNEAFHWFSRISGEHAGIRRERTIEHFKCTKCFHSWSKSY